MSNLLFRYRQRNLALKPRFLPQKSFFSPSKITTWSFSSTSLSLSSNPSLDYTRNAFTLKRQISLFSNSLSSSSSFKKSKFSTQASPFSDFDEIEAFIKNLQQYLNKENPSEEEESFFDLTKKPKVLEMGQILYNFYQKILAYEQDQSLEAVQKSMKPYSGKINDVLQLLRTKFGNENYLFPALSLEEGKVLMRFVQEKFLDIETGEYKKLNPEETFNTIKQEVQVWRPPSNRMKEKKILESALEIIKEHVNRYLFFIETSSALVSEFNKVNEEIRKTLSGNPTKTPNNTYENFSQVLDDFLASQLNIMDFGQNWKTPFLQYGMNQAGDREKPKNLYHFSNRAAFPHECCVVNMKAPRGLSRIAVIYWKQQIVSLKQVKNEWVWKGQPPFWWENLKPLVDSSIRIPREWMVALKKVPWPKSPELEEMDPRYWLVTGDEFSSRLSKYFPALSKLPFYYEPNKILDPQDSEILSQSDLLAIEKFIEYAKKGILFPQESY